MECNVEENFSMEWKKIASIEYEKIVFYSIPCPVFHQKFLKFFSNSDPNLTSNSKPYSKINPNPNLNL